MVSKKGAHSTYGRDYSDDETEFLLACEEYKKAEGLGYVRLTDAFHVLTSILGYSKPPDGPASGRTAVEG